MITGAVALAGCSGEQRAANSGAANINAAAVAAQGDIDTYAANSMDVASATSTTVPKAAPSPPPVPRIAAKPTPAALADDALAGDRRASLAKPGASDRPCATSNIAQAANHSRVSTRVDEAEFDRPDRDETPQRATAGVWQKSDGRPLSTDRDAGEPAGTAGCATP